MPIWLHHQKCCQNQTWWHQTGKQVHPPWTTKVADTSLMVTVHLLHRGEPYPPTDFITPILSIIILGSTDIEIAAKTRLDGTNWSADPTPVNHQGGQHITKGDRTFTPQGEPHPPIDSITPIISIKILQENTQEFCLLFSPHLLHWPLVLVQVRGPHTG